jgi:hypothetical protein
VRTDDRADRAVAGFMTKARVALILSEQEFSRLTKVRRNPTGYLDFLAGWRKRLQESASR